MMSIVCNAFDPANNMIAVVVNQLHPAEVELFRTSWRVYFDYYNTAVATNSPVTVSCTFRTRRAASCQGRTSTCCTDCSRCSLHAMERTEARWRVSAFLC